MSGGGMAVVAINSDLYTPPARQPERAAPKLSFSALDTAEITALPEELTLEQAEILAERRLASNPLKAYRQVCGQLAPGAGDVETSARRRPRRAEEGSPWAAALRSKMPIFTWLRQCDARTVRADIVAGLTVGVMVIPQSMSYGAIAGLPYINGMYSACIPTLIYAFFGQSKQLAVGPVAMVSLLVEAGLRGQLTEEDCPEWYAMGGEASGKAQYEVCTQQYVNLACLTAAVVGVMQVLGSLLKLGFLVSFLGHPVTSGFTSGAAIIIGLSQTKHLLGYDVPKSQFVYDAVWNIVQGLPQLNGMTFFLGSLFLGYLVANKKLAQKKKQLRMFGPLGPLVSCLAGSLLLLAVPSLMNDFHVKYVGHIPDGLMPLSFDAYKLSDISKVLPTAMSSCLIGYMESIAIGKNLASKHGYEIDAGQEMLALGISNIVGSAFSCYPVTGSFSRSAVNNSTGALTQLSGVVTAVIMFATLMFLTPLFYYLPKFVLAAVVLNSVIPLVAISEAQHLWKVKRNDCVLWIVAFLGTLFFGVLQGILVAVSLSLGIVIYESARPQITVLWRIPGTTIYRSMKQESCGSFIPNIFICRIGSSLYFANVQYVKEMLLAYVADLEEVNQTHYLVLELTPVVSIDSTACHVLRDLVGDFRSRGIEVAFAMVGNRVEKTMRAAQLWEFIGNQWFLPNVHEAVVHCLRHQHASSRINEGEGGADCAAADAMHISIGVRDEIGFSNDLHGQDTVIFISLANDVPMIMSEITAVFRRLQLTIIRAQVEPTGELGAKHTYFVRSLRSGTKLTERELDRAREELEAILQRHSKEKACASPRALSPLPSEKWRALSPLVSGRSRISDMDDINETKHIAALEEKLRSMQALLQQRVGAGGSGAGEQPAGPRTSTPWRPAAKVCCYWQL